MREHALRLLGVPGQTVCLMFALLLFGSGVWGWEDVLFGQCAVKYVMERRLDKNTSSTLVLEPRLEGKSDPKVLRPTVTAADGYHVPYPGPNKDKYLQKVANHTQCNRQPVLRVPWGLILVQD